MDHCVGDQSILGSLREQRTSKRRLYDCNDGDSEAHMDDCPAKKIKNSVMNNCNNETKRSTPLKRSPSKEPAVAVCSDFSDWDESPIKQAPPFNSNGLNIPNVTDKENTELDDSFDDPVTHNSPKKRLVSCASSFASPRKRSAALHLNASVQKEKYTSSGDLLEEPHTSHDVDSGVTGFPPLYDPKIEIELIVREVKCEDGLVDLLCVTEDGMESTVYLQDQWAELHIDLDARVRLIGAQRWGENDWLLSNEQGIMIVHPDTLVPCTGIAGATWCSRKVVLSERFRGPAVANKAMLIGTVVHELFQAAVQCENPQLVTQNWLLEIWHSRLRHKVISQLAALRLTLSHFEAELVPYLETVVDWVQAHIARNCSYETSESASTILEVHDIEENIWTPQLGLKGKVDVTVKAKSGSKTRVRSLELKTGKSGPSSEHDAQVMLYSLMHSSRYNQPISEGSLVYLKDGISRDVKPRALELKGIINQRNQLATHLSKLNPQSLPAPRLDPMFCEKCDYSLICSFYQVAVESGEKSTESMFNFAKSTTSHLSQSHLDYLRKWIRWIYSEWAEDQAKKMNRPEELWRKSVEQRELNGSCVGNLRLSSHLCMSPDGRSDFLLTFKRAAAINETIFSAGTMCTVSTSSKPGMLLAPIVECSATNITVQSDRLLDYENSYHIDVYNSFSTHPTTLGNLTLLMGNDEASTRLRELVIDLVQPSPLHAEASSLPRAVQRILTNAIKSNVLSHEQRSAVEAALLCTEYTLIEGLPGSGKTTTIVMLLRCLLEMKLSVLLTTNTHSALDNVLAKLRKHVNSRELLRLGNSTSFRDAVADLTLEAKLIDCDVDKHQAAVKILKETPIVASTCHYVPRELLFSWRKFDYCIIDEASMVLEPVCLPALAAANRFVLVGDAHQLAPLVQSRKCAEEGMSVSLFERLQVHKDVLRSLVAQYRMNSKIAEISSNLFYSGRLVCATESVARACLANSPCFKVSLKKGPWKHIESGDLKDSVVFVDTCAVSTPSYVCTYSTSTVCNYGEARLVCDIVNRFIENGISTNDIGVMCVYRKQVEVIKSLLSKDTNVEVNSVDQFQGRDKSVIIWSLVWTQTSERRCELLRDQRRINVAVTRAKHKLILVGCAQSMQSIDSMKNLIEKMTIVTL